MQYKARIVCFRVDGTHLTSMAGHVAKNADGSYWVYIDFASDTGDKFSLRSAESVSVTSTSLRLVCMTTWKGHPAMVSIDLRKSGQQVLWDINVTNEPTHEVLYHMTGPCTIGSLLILTP